MIKHIVLWTMKPDAAPKKKEEAKQRLEALKKIIPEIIQIEIGIDTENNTMSLYSEFASFADLAVYQNHPDHQSAGALIKPLAAERRVSDYVV